MRLGKSRSTSRRRRRRPTTHYPSPSSGRCRQWTRPSGPTSSSGARRRRRSSRRSTSRAASARLHLSTRTGASHRSACRTRGRAGVKVLFFGSRLRLFFASVLQALALVVVVLFALLLAIQRFRHLDCATRRRRGRSDQPASLRRALWPSHRPHQSVSASPRHKSSAPYKKTRINSARSV